MAGAQEKIVPHFHNESNLQTLEDFVKEQDELELQTQIAAEQARSLSSSSPAIPKRAKNRPDINAIQAENEALEQIGDINWVGRLLEYHQSRGLIIFPQYEESVLGQQQFTYSVTIPQNPTPITSTVVFGRKKDAKQAAAKLAIDWLISQNLMPSNGAIKFPQTPVARIPLQASPQAVNSPITHTSPATYSTGSSPAQDLDSSPTSVAAQVPILCMRLGFNCPTYQIHSLSPSVPLYYGWAEFGNDPRVDGKVGEFRDIYGKKNAKEVCAKAVLSFLKDIERQRQEGLEGSKKKNEVENENPGGAESIEEMIGGIMK